MLESSEPLVSSANLSSFTIRELTFFSHFAELLQLSGIGDSDHLGSLGIDVAYELPGVGMHLTDHLSAQLSFNTTGVEFTGDEVETNTTYAAAQKALWDALDPTSLYNSPNHA